jgi:asparagine synthase (glutamine-hydrolysing)
MKRASFFEPGVALASRRLSIVGRADGQQPVTNEEGNVVVVFNGGLFDHLEKRAELEARQRCL